MPEVEEIYGCGEMKVKHAKLAILLMTFGVISGGQHSRGGKAPDTEPSFRIAVNVDLVLLHASVRDRKGRVVSALREQDFDVYEDGVPQSIQLFRHEDIPVAVGLIVDHSGSMRSKLKQVIGAARNFVQTSNPQDQMFVVNFNENVSLGLPAATPFTSSSSGLEHAISNAPAEGMTALYDGIVKGIERLQASRHNKKVLLVISDGGDNASHHKLDHVLRMAEQSGAIIYTIGVFDNDDPDRNPGVLKRLSRETGGEAFFPEELSAVVTVCEDIARDIRNQYTIGYTSTNVNSSEDYRAIRVVARPPGRREIVARTRTGYIAGGEAQSGEDHGTP